VVNETTGELVEVAAEAGGLEQQTRGEIDIQIRTARAYPRSVSRFVSEVLSLATLNQETAAACFYALPRDGKSVSGPSARLAEIVASCWGHMRVEARVTGEDDHFVMSRAMAWDLQNNVAIAFEARRRITNKKGQRFNDDMIAVTANAASSIAIRNAIFKVVPSAFWRPIFEACRRAAVGDQKTLADRRAASLEYFQKMGIEQARVFALLGVTGIEDVSLEHVGTLLGLANAIKEGETSIDEAFPPVQKTVAMPQAKGETKPATTAAALPDAPAPTPTPGADLKQPTVLPWTPQAVFHIAKIERPDPLKNGHKVTTVEGLLAHTYHVDTVVQDLMSAAVKNLAVRFEGVLTTFAAAPLRIEKVIFVETREPGQEG
jgi:hypothetical protein